MTGVLSTSTQQTCVHLIRQINFTPRTPAPWQLTLFLASAYHRQDVVLNMTAREEAWLELKMPNRSTRSNIHIPEYLFKNLWGSRSFLWSFKGNLLTLFAIKLKGVQGLHLLISAQRTSTLVSTVVASIKTKYKQALTTLLFWDTGNLTCLISCEKAQKRILECTTGICEYHLFWIYTPQGPTFRTPEYREGNLGQKTQADHNPGKTWCSTRIVAQCSRG